MAADTSIIRPQSLNLYEPEELNFGQPPAQPKTPNAWFVQRYPEAYTNHGSPFLELSQMDDGLIAMILPISINNDFFSAVLGGRKDLGHHVVYLENELAWYFKDSDGIYKITSSEKLASQYRALMMKCAQDVPANVHKLNLFHEWRSDRTCKTIIQRAKAILAADHTFFSPTSSNQRIRGPELFERLMRVLCETMLEKSEGACLTVTQAYQVFCQLAQQRQLGTLKRSMFKATMQDLVRDVHGVALRHDVPDAANHHQQAWKGLKLVEAETLAA